MTRILSALATLCALASIVGCGSTGSAGSGTDIAKLAPPSSFFYAEATIDPSGDQQAGMRSILGDLPGTGAPQDRVNNLLEQAFRSDKTVKVDYLKDVKPWLGDKAAIFAAPGAGGAAKPAWAVVIASTDTGKTNDTIDKAKEPGDHKATYRGVDYLVDHSGDAVVGTLDGFLVAGSESGFKDAVDADKGDSLSASDRYKQALKGAASDRVGLVYEDLGGIFQAVAAASGQKLGLAGPFLGQALGGKPVVATIRAENQALVIDGSLAPRAGALKLSAQSTPLLADVPADSWLAFGMANFGESLKSVINLAAGMAGGPQALEQQLRAATGIDLQRDVLSWMGDVAVFVNGDSKSTIGGGLLIQSKDPATSRNALTKVAALAARSGGGSVSAAHFGKAAGYKLAMKSAPKPVYVMQAGDHVAITYGAAAAKAALSGSGGGLAGSASYKDAAAKLGVGYTPSLYLSMQPIFRLAESFGAHSAGYAKAKPYLSVLDYVIAGGAGATHSRARIGFRPHS